MLEDGEETQRRFDGPTRLGKPDRTVAALIVVQGAQAGRRFLIDDEAIIGRASDARVCLGDPLASRHHATLHPVAGGGFVIEDLGSRNGTVVNGERVDRRELRYGDRIQIGGQALLFSHRDPLQDLVAQRVKLEAIGRFGAAVAHDFNNLLGAAVVTINCLPTTDDASLGDADVRECLADVRSALSHAAALARRLLGFARRDRDRDTEVDVSLVSRDVIHLLRRTFPESVTVRADLDPELWVRGRAAELHQILMNLCVNARDAMAGGGVMVVRARVRRPDELVGVAVARPGPHVVLTVTDSGCGMDEETLHRVFEPFFTTKRQGSGAGLGLATVYEIAVSYGGAITVESAPDEGTTFTVYLPACQRPKPTLGRDDEDGPGALPRKVEIVGRILVVDDQALVRRATGRLLEHVGHSVVLAEHGAAALSHFGPETSAPDVTLLDMDMPVLDGVATLERIRTHAPEACVVCMSGHWDPHREQQVRQLGVLETLSKPFTAEELRATVTRGLEARGAAPAQRRS